MFKASQRIWTWVLNQFKEDVYQNSTETVEEVNLSLAKPRDAVKIAEAISNIDILSVNSPAIRSGYPILTLSEFNENQGAPIVIDCRHETVVATKNYLKAKKPSSINPQTVIAIKNKIEKALNQPARVVIKKRLGKIEPRFVIILYPTNQQPEALLFTTSNRRGLNTLGFEMEKKNLLWGWQSDNEPETSGIFLIK